MSKNTVTRRDVEAARKAVIDRGDNPSLDAIRIELGNRGSKTTIHRFVKEMEADEGTDRGSLINLSQPIQELVARLSERLRDEAEDRLVALETRHAGEIAKMQNASQSTLNELESNKKALREVEQALSVAQKKIETLDAKLQEESASRIRAAQLAKDLEVLTNAKEQHNNSLERDLAHARTALEHFQLSVKEQRELLQAQTQQQSLFLQTEISRLNDALTTLQRELAESHQENARSSERIALSEQALRSAEAQISAANEELANLAPLKQLCDQLKFQLAASETELSRANQARLELTNELATEKQRIQETEVRLSAAEASAAAHHGAWTQLQQSIVRTAKSTKRKSG